MPLPPGFKDRRVFASDATFPVGPEDWAGEENKVPTTGYAEGLLPDQQPTAQEFNYELNLASRLRFLVDVEALNWTSGEDATRAGLADCMLTAVAYIPEERIWIGGGSAAGTNRLLSSYNGRHWFGETPGGFPGVLNIAVNGSHAYIFVPNGDYYLRAPDGLPGDLTGPLSNGSIAAYASQGVGGANADNTQSWMAEGAENVWIAFRNSSNIPGIAKLTPTVGTIIPGSSMAGLASYTWSVNEYVSFLALPTRRVVCFVGTNISAVQHNVLRWSDDAPGYTGDWVGAATNTIRIVADVGKVVGLGVDDLGIAFALTSLGRVYASQDLETWVRRDTIVAEGRAFNSCVQVGGITYARGTWTNPDSDTAIEGIFTSTDFGITWSFSPMPLHADRVPQCHRLRAASNGQIVFHAHNTGTEISEIAFALRTS